MKTRQTVTRQAKPRGAVRGQRHRHLFEPGHFAQFCRSYTEELTRLRREHLSGLGGQRRRLAAAERRRTEILRALSEGYRSEAWKTELVELDAEIVERTALLQLPALPALHPNMAETFRQKATELAGLERGEQPGPAREALRGFIERIVIPPDGLLRVLGNLGSMLAAARGEPLSINACGIGGCGGSQPAGPLRRIAKLCPTASRPGQNACAIASLTMTDG